MKTTWPKTIILCVLMFCLTWAYTSRTTDVVKTENTFCAMCLNHIDTIGDKALRQWLDNDIRIEFKKWLINKEKNEKRK